MACYFMVDVYIPPAGNRDEYDQYIEAVKPVVERYGGEYLARTENVQCLSDQRTPQRVILIKFPGKEELTACFASEEYRSIAMKRIRNVDARAMIVEGTPESQEKMI